MKTAELIAMLLYFAVVIAIGVYFFFRDRFGGRGFIRGRYNHFFFSKC